MSDESTKADPEPSVESLAEMSEVTDQRRFRRRTGRGHHVNLRACDLVHIDADLLAYFGSAEAVNKALRKVGLVSELCLHRLDRFPSRESLTRHRMPPHLVTAEHSETELALDEPQWSNMTVDVTREGTGFRELGG
jgi:hypothetical protein